MLNLVARTANRETVLILEWQRGKLLALHEDGRLREYRVSELRADLLEAKSRIVINQRQNASLLEEATA